MGGNPKDSKWRSASNDDRVRKKYQFTMLPGDHEALSRLAEDHGLSMSTAIARVIGWLVRHPEVAAKVLRGPK